MISTAFGAGNSGKTPSDAPDKLSVVYITESKKALYALAFHLLWAVVILIPCFLCIIPCVPGFRNWEYKPSSQVHDDALQAVGEEGEGL